MTSTERALVSVGLPTRNRASTLVRAIESVIAQDYRPLELIISDNASTDATASICKEFAHRHSWIRHLSSLEDIGATGNFNRVREAAQGHYFMWLADDDWLQDNYISACVGELMRESDLVLVAGRVQYYKGDTCVEQGEKIDLLDPSPKKRILDFYSTVNRNGIFYGAMPRRVATGRPLKDAYGGDWLFLASLACLGKIRSLESTTIFRSVGGAGDTHLIRQSEPGRKPSVNQPHVWLSVLVFWDILNGTVYRSFGGLERLLLAVRCQAIVRRRFAPRPLRTLLRTILRRLAPEWSRRAYKKVARRRTGELRVSRNHRPTATSSVDPRLQVVHPQALFPKPDSAGILFLSPVPPALGYPNGFSSRYYHFVREVAQNEPADFLGFAFDCPVEEFLARDLPVQNSHVFPVEYDPPLTGFSKQRRRVLHYLFDPWPNICHPRSFLRQHKLPSQWFDRRLIISCLPHIAHIALTSAGTSPCIFLVEEGFHRVGFWDSPAQNGLKGAIVRKSESWRIGLLHRRIGRVARLVVVISDDEKEWLSQFIPRDKIAVVPHAVDCEYFTPSDVQQDIDIAVFGDLSHSRNADGAADFLRALRREDPDRRLKIAMVGRVSSASAALLESNRIMITGAVEDMRPYYARTKVMVVPSTAGSGVKTTPLEGWAMRKAIVASEFSLRGLPALPGENVLAARSPEELAKLAIALLGSPSRMEELAECGLRTVRSQRDIRGVARDFYELCMKVMEQPQGEV